MLVRIFGAVFVVRARSTAAAVVAIVIEWGLLTVASPKEPVMKMGEEKNS